MAGSCIEFVVDIKGPAGFQPGELSTTLTRTFGERPHAIRSERTFDVERTVDATGAACPGPLMDLIDAISRIDPGGVVRLVSDSEQSTTDVPEWVVESGNELIETTREDGTYQFLLRKT
jgi:TusA-related sulfurtransferase